MLSTLEQLGPDVDSIQMTHPFCGGGLDAEKCVSQVFLNQETQILDGLPKPELSCQNNFRYVTILNST